MREIKFRAWLKEEKEMIYPYVLDLLHNNGIADKDLCFRFEDIELMLFTGIYDKNGKEIYNGDIVKLNRKNYVVKYFEKYSRFGLSTNFEKNKLPIIFGLSDRVEVIGNIYENEDLLK